MIDLTALKVEWLITRRCNLSCSYCKVRNNEFPNELNLSQRKQVLEVIAKLSPNTTVVVFGGEPLTLKDDLIEVIRHGNEQGLYMVVISNSVGLTDEYMKRLVDAGLKNWSTSIDTLKTNSVDQSTLKRAQTGLDALRRFRKLGVDDRVTCTTVIPSLSKEGIWVIHTLLQKAGGEYNYSQPYTEVSSMLVPVEKRREFERVAEELYWMAKSGNYRMHNTPEYYLLWTRLLDHNIRCSKKSVLTVDADGSLMRCVDFYQGLDFFKVWDLLDEKKREAYLEKLKEAPACSKGCTWDPMICSSVRNAFYDKEIGKASFRHEINPAEFEKITGKTITKEEVESLFKWEKVQG